MIDIVKDKEVFKSNHLDPDIVQIEFPSIIIFLSGFISMYLAIKLHGEVFFDTIKIEDVISYAMLPSKFASGEF